MKTVLIILITVLFVGCNDIVALIPKEIASKIAECEQYNLKPSVLQNITTHDVVKVVCVPK